MSTQWIVVYASQSRQRYITANNRLKQSIGASRLIDLVTEYFAEAPGKLYVGGGVAAVVYNTQQEARLKIEEWSRHFLKTAPGLRLAAGWAPVTNSLAAAWNTARGTSLPKNEEWSGRGEELGAFPVVRTCPDTGGAASVFHEEHWLSAEAAEKEKNSGYVRPEYEQLLRGQYSLPLDFEDLGIGDGARQIAILHIDGNGIGELLQKLKNLSDDEEFRHKIGRLSQGLKALPVDAICEGLGDLLARLLDWEKEKIVLRRRDRGDFVPVRPVVDSGDDITLVCHGKLGLGLAKRICEAFEKLSVKLVGEQLTACAGVAIVPYGFPFQRAYALAEALCANAKKKHRENDEHRKLSWIDFQVITEGAQADLQSIRSASYRAGILAGRPYSLGTNGTFNQHFEYLWRQFTTGKWGEARSRCKKLLEAIASSRFAAEHLQAVYAAQGFSLPEHPHAPNADYAGYFDALEMLDFHTRW
jgi:hypothetical protein